MNFKHLKLAALALLVAAGFASCSDDELSTPPVTPPARGEQGMYVINQGSQNTIDGSIGYLAAEGGNYVADLFSATNGQSLGDSPQGGVLYGSKVYVPMYGSNLLWVLDAATLRIVAQVRTNQPEGVCATNGYVFVSNNDGYVTRVDTATFTPSTPLAVGPNPAQLAATGGKVYVSVSDGYNYENGYVNGFKVAVIDAATFTKGTDIAVGMNPGPIAADRNGNVYVVCRGDYYTVMPKVMRISTAAGTATDFADGSLVAMRCAQQNSRDEAIEDMLYVLDARTDYTTSTTTLKGRTYVAQTGEPVGTFLDSEAGGDLPANPVAIDVNPLTGDVYVSTDKTLYGYNQAGCVKVYSATGQHKQTYDVGVHPCGVIFR